MWVTIVYKSGAMSQLECEYLDGKRKGDELIELTLGKSKSEHPFYLDLREVAAVWEHRDTSDA